MAAVFYHHVVGDLTVGKPEIAELSDADTLDDAARAIAGSPEGAVPVWRARAAPDEPPSGARFLGMISAVDIAAFLATAGAGDRTMRAAVGEVVQPNQDLLREVDPGTRSAPPPPTPLRCSLMRPFSLLSCPRPSHQESYLISKSLGITRLRFHSRKQW